MRLSVILLLPIVGGSPDPPAATAQSTVADPIQYVVTGSFASPRLRESSGVAASRRLPGVLWTHNDSGDGPTLYATDVKGRDLGAWHIARADAVDWEDIALGLCPTSERTCLFIGDTGDNLLRRESATIYIVQEPSFPSRIPTERTDSLVARPLVVRYTDGPQDIEALAVTSQGDILLITKGTAGPIGLYQIPRRATAGNYVLLAPVGVLPIVPQRALGRLVTGAAVSPDGQWLAVRMYTQISFFALKGSQVDFRSQRTCWLGIREPQGEAVDFLDDSTLVLTSEAGLGLPGRITQVRCTLPRHGEGR